MFYNTLKNVLIDPQGLRTGFFSPIQWRSQGNLHPEDKKYFLRPHQQKLQSLKKKKKKKIGTELRKQKQNFFDNN